jgi:hypothetical protein
MFEKIIENLSFYFLFSALSVFPIFKPDNIAKFFLSFYKGEYSMISESNMSIIIQVVSVGLFVFFLYLAIKKTAEKTYKKMREPNDNKNSISVSSSNQSGGITAYRVDNINMEKKQRILTDELKKELLNAVNKDNDIYIHVKINDNEAINFAYQIRDFLKENGIKYKGMTAFGMRGGNSNIIFDKENNTILIGENLDTDKPLIREGFALGIESIE